LAARPPAPQKQCHESLLPENGFIKDFGKNKVLGGEANHAKGCLASGN